MTGFHQDLLNQLVGYRPSDTLERQHVERLLAMMQRVERPYSRYTFSPGHVTASAIVVDPAASAVLLIYHTQLGRWLQPGGHIEPGDSRVEDAARRELREEVGELELSDCGRAGALFDVDIHEIPARSDEPAHLHFDVRVLFRARTRDWASESGALPARWFPLEALEARDADASVVRATSKLCGVDGKAIT